VSLAAIKQLNTELKRKDAEIAELKAQYAAQSQLAESLAARMNALEQQVATASRTGSTIP
jgi:capsule polysaccharide export protein KpsE/RkpR